MKIYIAGPMTGLMEFNYPAFNEKAAYLRSLGFEVSNPAEIPIRHDWTWQDYMKTGIRRLLTCDAVYLLPDWSKSVGAKLEARIANDLGLPILDFSSSEEYLRELSAEAEE